MNERICPCGSYLTKPPMVCSFAEAIAYRDGLCLDCAEDKKRLAQVFSDQERRARRKEKVGW